MRDLILQCAGAAGIAVALIHGVLGETKVFARATIQPESLRTLIRLVWQAGTVAWIGCGVLLMAAPSFGSESARHWIVVTIVAVYAFAAAANAWWSRGRGFGWKALGVVVVLAVAAVLTRYCSPVSPLVRFLARSISVTAIRISARVFRSGASSIACFSAAP
jgi:hypothetical protein